MKYIISVLLLISVVQAFGQNQDQAAYCSYIKEQGLAQRDAFRSPVLSTGITPNNGVSPQFVVGVGDSVNSFRKASTAMQVAGEACKLYQDQTDAQQRLLHDAPALEAEALQHKVGVIDAATTSLNALIDQGNELVAAQNLTRPAVYLLRRNLETLETWRQEATLTISATYTPVLATGSLKRLVGREQFRNVQLQESQNKLVKLGYWDLSFAAGLDHPLFASADNTGIITGNTPFATGTFTFNLGSFASKKHLNDSTQAYGEWKLRQEGDIVRSSQALKMIVEKSIAANQEALARFQSQQTEVQNDLASLTGTETTAGLAFSFQLRADELLLRVQTDDLQFRIQQLREYLERNF